MVLLVQNTSLYSFHDFDLITDPLLVFLHQPITIQYSLSLIDFLVWWVEPTSLIKGNPLLIPTIGNLQCAIHGRNLVENSEMM